MGLLWAHHLEAGPADSTSDATEQGYSFIRQHNFGGSPSYTPGDMQDADNGDSVGGSGRYGIHPTPVGFGAVTFMDADAKWKNRAGDTIFFCVRVLVEELSDAPTANDSYGCLKITDNAVGPGENYFTVQITYKEARTDSTYIFTVEEYDTSKAFVATRITGTTTFTRAGTTGHHWIVLEYKKTSTTHLKLWVDGTQEGSTYSGFTASPYGGTGGTDQVPFLYSNAVTTGKASDKGSNMVISEMYTTDDSSTNGAPSSSPAAVADSISAVLHQPIAEGAVANWPTISPAAANSWCVLNNENNDDPGSQDYMEPSTADNEQHEFTLRDVTASATVYAVELLCTQGAEQLHNLTIQLDDDTGNEQELVPGRGYEGGEGMVTGVLVPMTPEATPANWTEAKANKLEVGLKTNGTTKSKAYEFYAVIIGKASTLSRPASSTDCAIAAATRRIFII